MWSSKLNMKRSLCELRNWIFYTSKKKIVLLKWSSRFYPYISYIFVFIRISFIEIHWNIFKNNFFCNNTENSWIPLFQSGQCLFIISSCTNIEVRHYLLFILKVEVTGTHIYSIWDTFNIFKKGNMYVRMITLLNEVEGSE